MTDRPDAAELLRTARAMLMESVLPRVPSDLRYTTLMIANAIAIAQREVEAADAPAREALARVRSLLRLGEPGQAVVPEDALAALREADRRLAAAIRAGRFDGEQRGALEDHLRKTTGAKVAISNPKAFDW